MRYLIDTNILIRLANQPNAISKNIRSILEDTDNLICVSAVSIQEIFMLMRDNKLKDNRWLKPADVFDYIEKELYSPIKYVHEEHLFTFANIIPAENHNDPSDRMIIAQAITERMPLISSDTKFHHYRKQKLEFIFNDK
ncbi:MAG: type II toxin-antitoxin system VapC family toxin [Candidatus Azobacteroides sp.]|nr:type II toxin-antitoxin system VapC family toxin [Candidatus Azobacteroides sp.]